MDKAVVVAKGTPGLEGQCKSLSDDSEAGVEYPPEGQDQLADGSSRRETLEAAQHYSSVGLARGNAHKNNSVGCPRRFLPLMSWQASRRPDNYQSAHVLAP